MKNKKQILDHVKKYPGAKVKFAVTDIDGILRGKIISAEKFMTLAEEGSGFCNVTFGWDSADVLYDNVSYTGWHTGYPDAHAKADINTFRSLPWEENIPFFLGDFTGKDGKALNVCPRSLLKKICGQAEKLGYHPIFSQEFEWFNFRETPQSLHEKDFKNPEPLTPGMFGYSLLRPSLNQDFFHELFDQLITAGIPLEG
ncbi:MAG TPA: hypothetical protein VNW99_10005, partial [Cytophagaceae bacterium]|nr:hypothetical protein [Cytophagaceae bacterium]